MWYAASIFMESRHQASQPVEGLWEESIVLIEASPEEEARRLAEQIGRSNEHKYMVDSPEPHLLRWTFDHVAQVYEIQAEALAHSVEPFSRFLRTEEAASLGKSFE